VSIIVVAAKFFILFGMHSTSSGNLVGMIVAGILILTVVIMVFQGIRLASRSVRIGLRMHNRRCVACDYDLRGTVEPRCPECGKALFNVPEPSETGPIDEDPIQKDER